MLCFINAKLNRCLFISGFAFKGGTDLEIQIILGATYEEGVTVL